MMGHTHFSIIGTGHALPVNNVHNIEFATHLDTDDDELIVQTPWTFFGRRNREIPNLEKKP